MLYFTRWKALAIIATALVVCLCAVPNFFPEARVKTWPVWAQRHVVLGLDLQGGSYLLLEVDGNFVKKERLGQIQEQTRRTLRDARIGFTGGVTVRGDAVEVRIGKETDVPAALTKLRDMSAPIGGLMGSAHSARSRSGRCRRRIDPPHRAAAGNARTHAQDHRAVDPDRRAPRQPARHRRTDHPAPGR